MSPSGAPTGLARSTSSAPEATFTGRPSTAVTVSPLVMPAAAAGEPSTTCSTRAPVPVSVTRSHTRRRATTTAASLASTISWLTCSRYWSWGVVPRMARSGTISTSSSSWTTTHCSARRRATPTVTNNSSPLGGKRWSCGTSTRSLVWRADPGLMA